MNLAKEKKVNITTIYKIVDIFQTTKEWLIEGKGEMLPNGTNHKLCEDINESKFWQEEVYIQQESKIARLEKEVSRLWNLLDNITNKSNNM